MVYIHVKMIQRKCFSRTWITQLRKQYPKTDPLLLEKTIYAFELLGSLRKHSKEFIFKGGTSIMLLLPEAMRLSIDIDIIGDFDHSELMEMIDGTVFREVKLDTRRESSIPKKHFAFYYDSKIRGTSDSIILDIVTTQKPYGKVIAKAIQHDLFEVSEVQHVYIPTIDGLLGEKLTAFAPQTVGIRYQSNKSMEIIKQLVDIHQLFDFANDWNEVFDCFHKAFTIENQFRDRKFSVNDVLSDIIKTSYLVVQLDLKDSIENDETLELRDGIVKIKSHLLSSKFTHTEAKIAASKTAYLAASLRNYSSDINPFKVRFDNAMLSEIENLIIEGQYLIVNRLKTVNPEAFYYWHLISQMEQS